MPSLAGVFRLQEGAQSGERSLERMLQILSVRGVRYEACRFADASFGAIALQKPDLDDSEQPARVVDGQVLFVDGEVYNARALARERLPAPWRNLGAASQCLELVRRDLDDTVRRLNGSFNLAYYDPTKGTLQLVSDRLGTRPLFYSVHGGRLLFALEIKAILAARGESARFDEEGIFQLAAFGHQLGSRTAFAGVSVVPPGSILTASAAGVQIVSYWKPRYQERERAGELSHQLVHAMEQAMRRRVQGRRLPLGIFLSGGLDSRFVAGALARVADEPVTAFTFGRDDSRDVIYARQLARALGFAHRTFSYHGRDFTPTVPRVVWRTEATQLFAEGLSVELHRHISEDARVLFNGHLGDALSGGHLLPALFWMRREHLAPHILQKRTTLPKERLRALCTPRAFDALYGQLRNEVERELVSLDEERLPQLFNLWDLTVRQRRYTLATPAVDRYLFEQLTPFVDNDLVDLMLGAPLTELFGQRAYVQAILDGIPEARHIPWARTAREIEPQYLVRMSRLAGDTAMKRLRKKLRMPMPNPVTHAIGELTSPGLRTLAQSYIESDHFPEQVFDRGAALATIERHFAGNLQFEELSLLLTLAAATELLTGDLSQVPPHAEPVVSSAMQAPLAAPATGASLPSLPVASDEQRREH